MLAKLKNALFKAKTYWKKPQRGYQVAIKEFVDYALGFGGISFLSVIVTHTTIVATTYMLIAYFKASSGLIWVMTILSSLITIIRSPILSLIIDNSHGRTGKFRPFLIWTSIAAAISLGIIPFIPKAWTEMNLFSFTMPEIAIFNIKADEIEVTLGIVVFFILSQIGQFFYTLLNQAASGIEQTITTNAQERANIVALKGLISNIPGSVVNMIVPILVGAFFTIEGVSDAINGYNNINLYRWIFPFCGVGGVVLMIFMSRGTRERAVIRKNDKSKTPFLRSMWLLTKNKYFWIINIFNAIMTVRSYSNLTAWLQQYTYTSGIGKTLIGLYCTTLLMNVFMIGMIAGPFLVKKFGKKNVLLVSSILFAVSVFLQMLAHDYPLVMLALALFQNTFGGFSYLNAVMTSDILDYEQYKSGKRLEGCWQNYSAIVTTIIGIGTSILLPLFLSFAGVGFSDKLSDKMADPEIRSNVYFYQSLLALIGSCVCVVPLFFYNLSEKKHAEIIKVLKIRAAIANHEDGEISDEEIIGLKDIVDGFDREKDKMIAEELGKVGIMDKINEIIKDYDIVKTRYDEKVRREKMADFVRECELEEKRVTSLVAKEMKKCAKNNIPCNEAELKKKYMSSERYLKEFGSEYLGEYVSSAETEKNIDEIYPVFENIIWKAEEREELIRKIRKEESNINKKVEKKAAASKKKGVFFDEEECRNQLIEQSKYVKRKGELEEEKSEDSETQ